MKMGVASLIRKQNIDCGDSGTAIRFLSLRASREKGMHQLIGSKRLMSRPMSEITFILTQLGVACQTSEAGIVVRSEGWKKPMAAIQVKRDHSSQFASSLLLNSWNLPFPVEFRMSGSHVSESYFQMSVDFALKLGMNIDKNKDSWTVPPEQKLELDHYDVEPDYSSMFAIAAAAALYGTAEFTNVGTESLQPDFHFFKILKDLGVRIERAAGVVTVKKSPLRGGKFSLTSQPDLFPVLAVLCAFADGRSALVEAPQLIHKESNRLAKTHELLKKAGVGFTKLEHGLEIEGNSSFKPHVFEFDSDNDHRMAMAAGLLKKSMPDIKILRPESVAKSFPGFWNILGIQ